jgi:hypothetical protein
MENYRKKMRTIDRIEEFIRVKDISFNAFDQSIGSGSGYISKQIRNRASVGADVIEKMIQAYEDINPLWLITGKGDMFLDTDSQLVNEPAEEYGKPKQDGVLKEKIIALQEQRIKDLEEIYRLKSEINELTSKINSSQS